MGDSLITIIAIFLAAILMFVFPLMSLSERTDDISQLAVATATNEFVDKIRTTGKITLDDYEKYIQTISSTGNSFEVEMQIQQLDENPGVKVTQAEMTKIGENVYYNKYTSQIEEELNNSKKAIDVLGGKILKVDEFTLPNSDIKRNIIIIKKQGKTPAKYPRKPGMPAKEPIL